MLSELEDARAKITSSRVYVSNEKENDQERLMGIKRQLTILRKEFEDSKMKWHQVLDGLRKRKASEEVKVRSLNEKFRQEVGEIAAMTRAARESVASMDGRIDAARVRAATGQIFRSRRPTRSQAVQGPAAARRPGSSRPSRGSVCLAR